MSQPSLRPLLLRQPACLGIGPGCSSACVPELVARKITSILLIVSNSAIPTAKAVQEECEQKGIKTLLLAGVPAEPSVADFLKVAKQAEGFDAQGVVGIGGGSVLDVAKLCAALLEAPETLRSYFGNGLLPERKRYLVCLPTTAGAGSEASPNAILYDEAEQLKKAVISPWLVPDATFIDARLSLTVPPSVTAATGLDALTHCIEAFANKNAHPAVDFYALEGARLICANLVAALANGADEQARAALALGSYYGGLCLGPVNTGAVHALAYPLGSRFRLAHGLSNALLLPHVLRFNAQACPERYAHLGHALGLAKGGSLAQEAETCIQFLETLCQNCGIPAGLSAVGVSEADLPSLVQDALKIQRLLLNNPREVTATDALSIYRNAL